MDVQRMPEEIIETRSKMLLELIEERESLQEKISTVKPWEKRKKEIEDIIKETIEKNPVIVCGRYHVEKILVEVSMKIIQPYTWEKLKIQKIK